MGMNQRIMYFNVRNLCEKKKTTELETKLASEEVCNAIKENVNCLIRGETLLHVACRCGNSTLVKKLLSLDNIDTAVLTGEKETALDIAYNKKDFEIVNILLDSGKNLNINKKNSEDQTLLLRACIEKQWDLVEKLLKIEDIEKDIQDINRRTPLKELCAADKNDLLSTFLSKERGVVSYKLLNRIDFSGNTVFHDVCSTGKKDQLDMLLSCGSKIGINSKNSDRKTPLVIAYEKGFYDLVELLLKYPDVSLIDFDTKVIKLDNSEENSFILDKLYKKAKDNIESIREKIGDGYKKLEVVEDLDKIKRIIEKSMKEINKRVLNKANKTNDNNNKFFETEDDVIAKTYPEGRNKDMSLKRSYDKIKTEDPIVKNKKLPSAKKRKRVRFNDVVLYHEIPIRELRNKNSTNKSVQQKKKFKTCEEDIENQRKQRDEEIKSEMAKLKDFKRHLKKKIQMAKQNKNRKEISYGL